MKYLIVYCGHDDSTSANGVCVWNIAKELRSRGHEVWAIWQFKEVLNAEFEKNGVHCYGINESWYYTYTQWHATHRNFFNDIIYKGISFLRLFYVMPLYPNISPIIALKSRRLADKIIKENSIDMILGIYLPYHAINTTLYLKRKYKDKLFVTNYHLDLISSPINTNRVVRSYKLWKGNKAVKKELDLIDLMLLPMSGKGLIESEKIAYVDFPLFVKNQKGTRSEFIFPQDSVNITYVGSLDANNRNPSYIISLVEQCNAISEKKIVLHIWGNLADKETREIIDIAENVQYHGLLENQYVQDILSRSDCLLNVSNAVTYNMIPSKIFQMFSMHKPIINIVRHEKDASLVYFAKYPNVKNIYEFAPSAPNVQTLCDFMLYNDSKQIDYNDDLYIESTPGFICDCFDKKQAK